MSGKDTAARERLILPVAVATLIGWSAALVFAFVTGQFAPLTAVTPLMLLLAGYAFGTSIVKTAKGASDDA